jgi:hypothetical protein
MAAKGFGCAGLLHSQQRAGVPAIIVVLVVIHGGNHRVVFEADPGVADHGAGAPFFRSADIGASETADDDPGMVADGVADEVERRYLTVVKVREMRPPHVPAVSRAVGDGRLRDAERTRHQTPMARSRRKDRASEARTAVIPVAPSAFEAPRVRLARAYCAAKRAMCT